MSAPRSSAARRKPARRPAAARPRLSPDRAAAELCRQVLAGEGVGRAEVALAFGGDDTLRGFNRRYRGIDRATDVLSFLYEDQTEGGVRRLAGDLVVSVPRVLAQARRYRVTPGRELARLVIHGALHLCGHDHVKAGERQRMRARERVHLRALRAAWEQALTRLVEGWARRVD